MITNEIADSTYHTKYTLRHDPLANNQWIECECGWIGNKFTLAWHTDAMVAGWWEHVARSYSELVSYMRPVIDAAIRYRNEIDYHSSRDMHEVFTCESVLTEAIDLYMEASKHE